MTGTNSIEFNEATMIEIVQFYLDNKMLNKDELSPKVVSVRPTKEYPGNAFDIVIEGPHS